MEKEFEALEIHLDRRIADIKRYLEFNERSEDEEKFTPVYELKICYLAKEMLAIKEAKPSEALECLAVLEECASVCGDYSERAETVRNVLLKAQEQEKVLEVIFKKKLNTYGFKLGIDNLKKDFTYEVYKTNIGYYHNGFKILLLTQEEFELLKKWAEVLK